MQYHPTEMFPFIIEGIFAALEDASFIRIAIRFEESGKGKKTTGNVVVTSVNGHNSPQRFLHSVDALRVEALKKLRKAIFEIHPDETDLFFEHVFRVVRRISRSWSACRIRCVCNGAETENAVFIGQALAQVSRYDEIFHLLMKKLENKIHAYCGAAVFLIRSVEDPIQPEVQFKLNLKCSVKFAGALLRIFYILLFGENTNKADLCRQAALLFSTDRQENISSGSLRNSFDSPELGILMKLRAFFHLCIAEIDKIIKSSGL